VVQYLSKYFIDLERVIRTNRICIYGTDECKISLKKHTHAACHCFFVLLIFLFQHTVNKRTMSSKRLMGCDNSLESANGAADQQDWRQKFFSCILLCYGCSLKKKWAWEKMRLFDFFFEWIKKRRNWCSINISIYHMSKKGRIYWREKKQ